MGISNGDYFPCQTGVLCCIVHGTEHLLLLRAGPLGKAGRESQKKNEVGSDCTGFSIQRTDCKIPKSSIFGVLSRTKKATKYVPGITFLDRAPTSM